MTWDLLTRSRRTCCPPGHPDWDDLVLKAVDRTME